MLFVRAAILHAGNNTKHVVRVSVHALSALATRVRGAREKIPSPSSIDLETR